MATLNKQYTNGEITILWQPALCIHSTICWKKATGLPEVFNPAARPWITMEGTPTDQVIEQVRKCPSGALSFYYNTAAPAAQPEAATVADTRVEVMPNGPLLVHGNLLVCQQDGSEIKKTKTTAFCRCGHSANKPFCDGSHSRKGFEG